jgi:MHS family proline/betaine transporter-like MFS transporter
LKNGAVLERPVSAPKLAKNPFVVRAVLAATAGNLLEWYDFAVYGYFSAMIGRQFFPAASATTPLLLTFASFGVEFLMQPLGAPIVGVCGDRFGRKNALMLSMGLMAAGTGGVGLLPAFDTWEMWPRSHLWEPDPSRGFSAGGESGGSIAFIVEYAPPRMRGIVGTCSNRPSPADCSSAR